MCISRIKYPTPNHTQTHARTTISNAEYRCNLIILQQAPDIRLVNLTIPTRFFTIQNAEHKVKEI